MSISTDAMDPLTTIVAPAQIAASVRWATAPLLNASSDFADWLSHSMSADSSPGAAEGTSVTESLSSLLEKLSARAAELWGEVGAAGTEKTIQFELSPLGHVYVDGSHPQDRQLEEMLEHDQTFRNLLNSWLSAGGPRELELDLQHASASKSPVTA